VNELADLEREGASLVTVQQLIDVLLANGWRETKSDPPIRLQQETLGKIVTISGRRELPIPPGALRTLLRYAQIQE
jgi:hypothetical protein